jgi:hypothetical protein
MLHAVDGEIGALEALYLDCKQQPAVSTGVLSWRMTRQYFVLVAAHPGILSSGFRSLNDNAWRGE